MEIQSKNELKILNLFRSNLFLRASIRDIMKKLKSKSYQRIHEAIQNLVTKNILKSEKMGANSVISLNFSREAMRNFAYLDEHEASDLPNYSKIMEIKEISDYLILVTGSYARGNFTKKSDLDLVIIVPDKENPVFVQKLVENITLLYLPKVHLYVFTKKDFIEMLKDKSQTYGKEIVENRKILKNAQIFYELVKEAVESGYKS